MLREIGNLVASPEIKKLSQDIRILIRKRSWPDRKRRGQWQHHQHRHHHHHHHHHHHQQEYQQEYQHQYRQHQSPRHRDHLLCPMLVGGICIISSIISIKSHVYTLNMDAFIVIFVESQSSPPEPTSTCSSTECCNNNCVHMEMGRILYSRRASD